MFPLSNFLLPFFIFGDDINIRIYLEGSFFTDAKPIEDNTFPDEGIYSLGKPQGYIHKINPESIYISILYVLIFFLTAIFTFTFRNKYLNYRINFLEKKKKSIFKYFLCFLFLFCLLTILN